MSQQSPMHVLKEPARSSDTAAAKRRAQSEQLLRDSLTLSGAAAKTGASEQRLLRLVSRGGAIAFSAGGEMLFPAWQLRSNEMSPVISDVQALAESFPGDLAALNAWIHSPHEDLGGVQPMEVLETDGVEYVLVLVRAIGAAGT